MLPFCTCLASAMVRSHFLNILEDGQNGKGGTLFPVSSRGPKVHVTKTGTGLKHNLLTIVPLS